MSGTNPSGDNPSRPTEDKGKGFPFAARSDEETRVDPHSQERIPIAREIARDSDIDPDDIVGKFVGPYLVEKKLAKGGMGLVFLAYDETLRRKVALKVMDKALLSDEDALKRFEREARAAASIQHKNIASIFLVGLSDEGRPFLAMEFVEGGTLLHVIKRREQVPFSQIALWMEQVASALQAASRKNIIHRDIKPANIMLTGDGDVKVVDFGLAKIFFEDSYMTQEGMVLGTPSYMAPEQGQGRVVDRRADIYSVGATFYHLITGRPPFVADSPVQIMMKHVTAPLISMRSINPAVPIEFDEVISKCMRKDVDERYQDYESFLLDIQRVRLQVTSREQGSIIGGYESIGSKPTHRTESGLPMPPSMAAAAPGGESRAASGAAKAVLLAEENGAGTESAWTPARLAITVVALLAVLAAAGLAFWRVNKEEPADAAPGDRPGAVTAGLIRSAAERARNGGGKEATPFEAYSSTVDILRNLRAGIRNFQISEEQLPDSLAEIANEKRVLVNFEVDSSGIPLDGWNTLIGFDPREGTIRSAGQDRRHYSGDDIYLTLEGEEHIPDVYLQMRPES